MINYKFSVVGCLFDSVNKLTTLINTYLYLHVGLNKCKEGRFFFGQRQQTEAADDVTMSESVKVIARSRPLNEAERKMKTEVVLSMDTSKHQCTIRKPSDSVKTKKVFTFDGVYGSSSSTDKIYSGIVRPIVQGVLEGYNGTVFAYGQTSCGKTFTMEGVSEPETQTGIIPRCFKHILSSIHSITGHSNGTHSNNSQTNCPNSSSSHGNSSYGNNSHGNNLSGKTYDSNNSLSNSSYGNSNYGNRTPSNNFYDNREYLLHVSFLEIYNEEIRDLLVKNTGCKLEIKEHPDKGMYVKGLSSITVDCYDDMNEILAIGSANRSVGATCMNTDSSRSHSIFIIDLEMSVYHGEGKEFFRNGKLNLVDLAGSERQGKSLASGERFREATRINLSLSALGNVISALVDGKIKHIPYRDSKLTRLLQDSLGGNSRTLMIACISPGANNYEETLTTLRYAKRAKNIKNRPRINEDPKDTLIKKYQEEIEQLKRIIAKEIEIPPHIALEIEGTIMT